MTNYYKIVSDGYIIGIGTNGNDNVTEITESEYSEILAVIAGKPADPEGYTYKLRADDLELELVELPEPIDEEAGLEDYEQALQEMGVDFSD